MLRKIRIVLETVFFLGITALLLGTALNFGGWHENPGVADQLGWMAKLQFLPSLLAGNFIVVAALVLLTLVFGRIYCSVICPLGSLQDIVNHISSRFHALKAKKKKSKKAEEAEVAEEKDPATVKRVAAHMAVEDFKSYVVRNTDRDAVKAKEEELRQELEAAEAELEELGERREDEEPVDWRKMEELKQAAEASVESDATKSGFLNQGRVVRKRKEVTKEEKDAKAKAAAEAADKRRKSQRLHFHKELKWVRYIVWVLFVAALIAGIQALVALLAPYSAYGRIVSSIVNPHGWIVPVVAGITLVAIVVLAWTGGRTYCNVICPVGTTLSFFSRFAIFRPMIDKKKCVSCGNCEKNCKSQCIDSISKTIDYSRCVDCFDCISSCKPGGLKYRFAYGKAANAPQSPADLLKNIEFAKPVKEEKKGPNIIVDTSLEDTDEGRRAFINGAVMAGTALAAGAVISEVSATAQNMKLDGGLAEVLPKQAPKRETPIVPAGSGSVKDFYRHCTACQLCVENCPNKVLRPSLGLDHLMQPEMGYEHGYCRPECTKCSQVCPAGAIKKLEAEQKASTHIGHAVVNLELCVVNTDEVSCGNCAAHCPAGAIKLVKKNPEDENSPRIPTVNAERCIGCGACEFLCPARPISAIHIEGNTVHTV
ncbi:MAG: 4Fe-4S binding protein [Bacteroidales bacterium]|nr:4Fe-4S binding protein [Bacteroidales bacterium]